MATEKAGRVTFMPLNRLRTRPTVYPSGADAIPMMSKLTFDPMFQKALEQVSHTCLNGINCHHRKTQLNGFAIGILTNYRVPKLGGCSCILKIPWL
jgi:hypothetical protein